MQLIDPFGDRAQDQEGDVANYHMWPFILLYMHVMSRYMFIHMDTLMFYMLFPDTYILYGHFDVLYVYFQIHVYIMDTLMFYMLFPDTCLYHGHFDVL